MERARSRSSSFFGMFTRMWPLGYAFMLPESFMSIYQSKLRFSIKLGVHNAIAKDKLLTVVNA